MGTGRCTVDRALDFVSVSVRGRCAIERIRGGSRANAPDRCCRRASQDPQPGAVDGDERDVLARVHERVLAVAEEEEVPVGEPVEQRTGLGDLLARDRAARLVESVAQLARALHHLRPVLDRAADVPEHVEDLVADVVEDPAPVAAVDLHVHERLARDDRVHEQQHVAAEALQRHPDRVDEERHVVGDDLHDGVGRAPAVLGLARARTRGPGGFRGSCVRARCQSESAAPVSSGTPWARRSSSGTQR